MRKKKQPTNRELLIEQCLYDAYCEENNIINEGMWDNIKANVAGAVAGAWNGLKADAANSFRLRSRDQIKNDVSNAAKQGAQSAKIKSYAKSLSSTLKSFIQAGGKLGTNIDNENDVLQRLERIKQGLDPGFDARTRQKAEQHDRQVTREQRRQNGNQASGQNRASSLGQNVQNTQNPQNNAAPQPDNAARAKTDNELAAEKEAAARQQATKNKGQGQSAPAPASAPANEAPPQYNTQQSDAQDYSQYQQEPQPAQGQKNNLNWLDRGMQKLGRAYGSVRNMGKNFTAGRLQKDATAMSDKLDAKEKVREQRHRTDGAVNSDAQNAMLDSIDQPGPVEPPKTSKQSAPSPDAEQPAASPANAQASADAQVPTPEQPAAPEQPEAPADAQPVTNAQPEQPVQEQPADNKKPKQQKTTKNGKKKQVEQEGIQLAPVPGVDPYSAEWEERPQRKKITESRYNFTNTNGQISMLNSIL